MIDTELIKQAAANALTYRRRETLEPEEEEALHAGKHNWFPKLLTDPSDPLPEDLASPFKNSLMKALPMALGGAGLGYVGGRVLSDMQHKPEASEQNGVLGAALLGGGAGLGSFIKNYIERKDQNELIEEHMRSLPPHATRRMLELDPLYQMEEMRDMDKGDLDRAALARRAMVRFR